MPWAWRWCSARAVPVPVGVFSSPLSPPSTPTSFKMQDQQCKARRSKSMMVNNLCTKWVNMKHNETYGDIRGFHIALFHRDSQLVSTTLVVQLNRQTQLPLGRGLLRPFLVPLLLLRPWPVVMATNLIYILCIARNLKTHNVPLRCIKCWDSLIHPSSSRFTDFNIATECKLINMFDLHATHVGLQLLHSKAVSKEQTMYQSLSSLPAFRLTKCIQMHWNHISTMSLHFAKSSADVTWLRRVHRHAGETIQCALSSVQLKISLLVEKVAFFVGVNFSLCFDLFLNPQAISGMIVAK